MKTTLKQIALILLVSGFLALTANLIHPRRIPWVQSWSDQVEAKAKNAGIRVIPFSVALEKFQSPEVLFIDARRLEAFEDGHIPAAVSLPFESLEDQFPRIGNLLDSGNELIVYCANRDCDDAFLLAAELQAMGAENLLLFIDGFEAWAAYGGAVEP
ncbi:rhodanese-like domain-containing protein [Pontiella agarivorans]|uniref:Rhodanese-like domain-containing protein n=1 Tax=Pontiella agarivorans TaxID=3038953 RepID=A0ABU5MWT7_9BACT|nr:rhodanese-like domain-containing protein [Pontiella agarivorans]MDZ8118627.1 rhodanese-like domain-containing protein [Pontiella agarivorans]